MKRVCAWCHKPLNDESIDGSLITHGICDDCAESMRLELRLVSLAAKLDEVGRRKRQEMQFRNRSRGRT